MRVGEIVALEWSDIDLERRQIARLKARVHCDDEVASRAEVPCLNQSHIASRFQLPRNPLRPSAIVLVVADEEICLRTCRQIKASGDRSTSRSGYFRIIRLALVEPRRWACLNVERASAAFIDLGKTMPPPTRNVERKQREQKWKR